MDVAFDACGRWPFPDGFAREIYSSHTLEHLPDYFTFFRESWRVLIPNGVLRVRVPHGWHQSCWWDFTHLRPWLPESFATLQPGFTHFTRNHQHEHLGFAFWVANCVLVLDKPWSRMWRFRPLRPLVRWAGKHLLNVYRDCYMEAFKTVHDDPESSAFGGAKHPAVVPCSYGVYEHEYYGRSADGLEVYKMLVFVDANTVAGDG